MNSGTAFSTGASAPRSYLESPRGRGAWLATDDHKKIGLMFLGWTLAALLIGTVFGILLTVKSLGGRGLDPRYVFQAMTYHRVFLVFAFLVPAVPSVLGYFLLPLQLGARNLALPRFSRASLGFHALGVILILASIALGPVATGWTMDARLSLSDSGAFGVMGLGVLFLGLGWFLTGLNFVVTVHRCRAPGMGFFTMPILAWSLYLVGYVLIVSGLLLAVILLYLLAARIIQTGVFGAQADPRLWQNYFWFAMRPAALFALLPAAGVISEVVAGVSRKGIAGYRMVVGSLISLMGLGFVTWGIQLGGLGQDPGTTLAFSGLGAMAVVPVALIAYAWLATLQGGAIADTPLDIFVLGFFLHAGIAALMELLLISPALGAYLGNSMFASTRLDYLIWGGALGSLLAGLHYWWPLMTGAMYSPGAARVGGSFYVLGLNLALIPRMMMGTRGVAQDMMAFEPGPTALSELSALGWLVMFCGLAVILANLYASSWRRERAGDNPWGVSALEWTAGSPPPSDNFETAPVAGRPYSS